MANYLSRYVSALRALWQLPKLIALNFLASKSDNPKLGRSLEKTLVGGDFYQQAPPVKEQGYCPENQPTKVL